MTNSFFFKFGKCNCALPLSALNKSSRATHNQGSQDSSLTNQLAENKFMYWSIQSSELTDNKYLNIIKPYLYTKANPIEY